MTENLYFVCNWKPQPTAWLSIKPYPDAFQVGSVKWRGQPVTVNIVWGEETVPDIQKVPERPPPDLYALLKSNLQKQVRRRKPGAVHTAARLWELGQFELLRRLVIIAAEDVEISAETAVVTWMMAAKSKGFTFDDEHRRWVLGYVQALVKHDTCRRLIIKPERDYLNAALTPTEVLNSDHSQAEQLAAILFRTAYGGLAGDPPMLARCVDWQLQGKRLISLHPKPWDGVQGKVLINRAAIDHHIWFGIVAELADLHPDYAEDTICTVIWECSSGINARHLRECKEEWKQCWIAIKDDFAELTKGYLSRLLKRHPEL